MTTERWKDVREKIRTSFTVTAEYEEDLEPGIAEILEFDGPAGPMKVRFVTRPRTIGKTTQYTHRGAATKVDYQFDPNETVTHLEAYRWNEQSQDWVTLDVPAGTMFF